MRSHRAWCFAILGTLLCGGLILSAIKLRMVATEPLIYIHHAAHQYAKKTKASICRVNNGSWRSLPYGEPRAAYFFTTKYSAGSPAWVSSYKNFDIIPDTEYFWVVEVAPELTSKGIQAGYRQRLKSMF